MHLIAWLDAIERQCQHFRIPQGQWSDVAIYFLPGNLRSEVQKKKKQIVKETAGLWDWESFQVFMIQNYGQYNQSPIELIAEIYLVFRRVQQEIYERIFR